MLDPIATAVGVISAIGTVLVAVVAVWGDWLRDKLAGPKLEIKLANKPILTSMNGRKVVYHHLVVSNRRSWAVAKGVQVFLTDVSTRTRDGTFVAQVMSARLPLTWAYPKFSPVAPSIRDERSCDLGYLIHGESEFKPSLYFYPNNFTGYVRVGSVCRMSIEVHAENFSPGMPLVIEVSWDGQWSEDMDEMATHLVARNVTGR